VIAFLSHVEDLAGEPARWLHLGMTSSDVIDTAFALQLRQAGRLIGEGVGELRRVVKRRALELKMLPMVGRSHGIHAEPTSVGLVFAGWYAELTRVARRLEQGISSISVGKIAGAVGNYGNISPSVEAAALASLGLQPEDCATQIVQRDRHADFFLALAQLAATLERFALQIRHWQRTEVSEVQEPFGRGQKGSSAMPHKRNPILSENVCGLARLLRSYGTTALENVPLWHERDISHSSVERVVGPDATALADFMVQRMIRVIDGLTVNESKLRHNLGSSGGLIFSESVLLALVRKGLPRQKAYELVQEEAMAAAGGQGDFLALLRANAEIGMRLAPDELEACFDMNHHLRHVHVIFERVFGGETDA
jgi:adenylosuccinate lyase